MNSVAMVRKFKTNRSPTEFIGVSLALGYFGVSEYISVPIAAIALVVDDRQRSFRRWGRSCSSSSR